ncbi:hypothetical protein H696_01626 [Fonticula alba]|uniref:Cytochrome c oxidase assembly protein COX20, mitochondrial n=1 Tax=Fonticula alba TaxID=691883 RepID=A0A058ZE50_FONAL|nr:hypothetical protein H696_01626 [Fonticula alba]KCV72226.1 hypothetical protein H696_01626 [Fonticula alba]|eukprot:XP_009493804.1 hypothetical protein H696_01626 [Fonticula alba]
MTDTGPTPREENAPRPESPVARQPIPTIETLIERERSIPFFERLKMAVASIRPSEDLARIGSIPCARESLLYGISTSVIIGACALLSKRPIIKAVNYSILSFGLVSITSWEYCRYHWRIRDRQHRLIGELGEMLQARQEAKRLAGEEYALPLRPIKPQAKLESVTAAIDAHTAAMAAAAAAADESTPEVAAAAAEDVPKAPPST